MNNDSKIVLGTEIFKNFDIHKIEELVDFFNFASSKGVNEIDCATSYGVNSYVEKLIGTIMKNSKYKLKCSTKFLYNEDLTFITNEDQIKKSLEKSLNNMNADKLEIYYFHSGPDEIFFNNKIWKFLNKMKDQKVIKKLGLSLKHANVINNNLKQLHFCKNYEIDVIQSVLNLYSKESLKEVVPFCADMSLDFYSRMPLAKGLLSGKYREINDFHAEDPRLKDPYTQKILKYVNLNSKKININTSLNWPLKYSKKTVLACKNKDQLTKILSVLNE